MFAFGDTIKKVDPFPRTNSLKKSKSYPYCLLEPCWVRDIDVEGKIAWSPESLIYQGSSHIWVWNPKSKNEIFSLRGNRSRNALFDS